VALNIMTIILITNISLKAQLDILPITYTQTTKRHPTQ